MEARWNATAAMPHVKKAHQLNQRNRKLAGIFLFVGLLVFYPLIATIIYEQTLTGAANWVLLIYFVMAGFGWAVPAGLLIKWMSYPDQQGNKSTHG